MTSEEILALPAGRALDALVAEKVLGWTSIGQWCDADPPAEDDWIGVPPEDARQYCEGRCAWLPYYSTEIDAAWQVVEKLHQRLYSDRRHFLLCLTEVVSEVLERKDEWVSWPDAFWLVTPGRICRAALLATLNPD